MKIFKYIRIILLICIVAIILLLSVIYINHKIHLSKEDALFIPTGQMVQVNGHDMHIYSEGEGDKTLVFMSGGGTSSPVLDFKSLYSLLSTNHKVVVVEKAGYGFSEIADIDRDIDTILSETREALSKSGIDGPYILCPHSMSGIEALYWAQNYSNEIRAIIGLDMAVPDSYQDYDINIPMLKMSALGARLGITRWIPGIEESDAIRFGSLTEEEKELYRVIFYRRTASSTMINEVEEIKDNARKVKENGIADIPFLIFSSNGDGTGWDESTWINLQKDFVNRVEDGILIKLDSPHYIHNYEYEKIAKEIDNFTRRKFYD